MSQPQPPGYGGNIERSYINAFKGAFETAFQQRVSHFRPYVEEFTQNAEFEYHDRIHLADDMKEVTTRYGDNPFSEIPHSRRRNQLRDWEQGVPFDTLDLLRLASNPSSNYIQELLASARRNEDKQIIASLFAPVYTGKQGEEVINFVSTNAGKVTVGQISNTQNNIKAEGSYALGSGMVEGVDIASDYSKTGAGGTQSNLTSDKLIAAREVLLKLEAVEHGQLLPIFVDPNQQSALLRESGTPFQGAIHNLETNTQRTLVNGFVDTWLGFKFIYVNNLPKVGNIRQCVLLGPKGLRWGIGAETKVDGWRLTAKKNIPYIYVKQSFGGYRNYGEHVVRINVDETVG